MLQLRLAGGLDAPARARFALSGLNGSLGEFRDSVRLLVSELVANAVKHAGAGPDALLEIALTATPGRIRAEVSDRGPGFEHAWSGQEPLEGGFGLTLLDELADRWGVRIDRGAHVWFEIDRNPV
jgi:anti-sigma regulatory factor (Ser/Thr protein kinase)